MTEGLVLTGAMGGGKTAVLEALKSRGVSCVPEPARIILAQQRAIGGRGVPETDAGLFTMLMLSRALQDGEAPDRDARVFDRGVPDMVAYAELFGLDTGPYWRAAERYRYGKTVLYFPPWEAIYTNDDERKIPFEGARDFGLAVRRVYETLGYQVIDVPLVSLGERVEFVLNAVKARF